MATYLTLVNIALTSINEVLLTTSNFSTATGQHADIKNAVNAAIFDIMRREQQWPFNYGKQTFNTVIGTQEYTPQASIKNIKWTTFGITRDDNASPKITAQTLMEMDYNTYTTRRRPFDQQMEPASYAVPDAVIKADNGNIIISPPPRQVMEIYYDAWVTPDALVNHSDTCNIPDSYNYIIADGAKYYGYNFRGDVSARNEAKLKFDTGVMEMQRELIKPADSFKSTMIIQNRMYNSGSIPSRFGL